MKDEPIKILRDGTFLPAGSLREDHVGVLLPLHEIIVHPYSLGATGDGVSQQKCIELCRQLTVFAEDKPGDWELATVDDWKPILDYTRRDPALDRNLYPGIKPRWHWTSTDAEWSRDAAGVASAAWFVLAYSGIVNYDLVRHAPRVRPRRSSRRSVVPHPSEPAR